MKKHYLLLALLSLPALALANTSAYHEALSTLNHPGFVEGPLATGLGITLMLMGALVGVARNSPLPAFMGSMGAMLLHFGPPFLMAVTGANSQSLASGVDAIAGASGVRISPTSSVVALAQTSTTPAAATSAPRTLAATVAATANSIGDTDIQLKKAVMQAPELGSILPGTPVHATTPTTESVQPIKPHPAALTHTVPVPSTLPVPATLNAPSISTSQMTKWVGLGGAAIILTLLGLLAFLSAQRRARSSTGLKPGSATPAATTVFQDPHGFQREKRSLTFGHESL